MIRDSHSNALLETDKNNLLKYRKEKKREQEFQQLKDDVQTLRFCINTLKERVNRIEEVIEKK